MSSDKILCISRIKQHYYTMSSGEKKVADFILKDYRQVQGLSTAKLAELSGVSPATVVRFCRSLGFKGISEFKIYLEREKLSPGSGWMDVEKGDSISIIAQKNFQYIKAAIDETLKVIDFDVMEKAVKALNDAPNIAIIGEGGSGNSSRCAYDTFLQINMPCTLLEDPFYQILSINNMKPGDVAFTVCHSGRAHNTLDAMNLAKEKGVTTIAIVGIVGSPLAKLVDIPLYIGVAEHRFFSQTVSARICELSIISTLQAVLSIRNRNRLGDNQKRIDELLRVKRVKK